MATSDPKNDPKPVKAVEARILKLTESNDARELTPDEEKSVVGGAATGGGSGATAHKAADAMSSFAGS